MTTFSKYILLILFLVICEGFTTMATITKDKISVLKSGKTVYIRSFFSDEQDIVTPIGIGRANNQINFSHAYLIDKRTKLTPGNVLKGICIHRNNDDSTPWNLNGTYIGGNHGCSDGREIVSTGHGFSEKDLGSEWLDSDGEKFYIIKIADKDRFWILSENKGKGDVWKFNKNIKGKSLKNSQTGKLLNIEKIEMVQITPACRIKKQECLVNGKTPLEDGVVTNCDFLDIVEDYDIIATDSLLEATINNAGKKIDFTGSQLDSVVNNRITYQFQPYGTCVIDYKARADRDFNLSYMGFIQAAPLFQDKFKTHEYYIPKVKPFEEQGRKFDFRGIQDYTQKRDFGLYFNKGSMLADKNNLPERFIQFLGTDNERKVGFVLGYSLISGITKPEIRAKNCKRALFLWTSQKSYPSAIDSRMGMIKKGQIFHCIAYRQYFQPHSASKNATCVYWNKQNGSTIVYIDYHKSVQGDTIQLPIIFKGKKISVVEKTPGIKLTQTSVPDTGIINVSTTNKTDYIVLKLD